MESLAYVALLVITLGSALHQLRQNHRRGIRMDIPKTVVTGGGIILIVLVGMAGLFLGLEFDRPLVGVALFLLVFAVGMIWLIAEVNLRWPPPPGVPYLRISRKSAALSTAVCGLVAIVAIYLGWQHR